MVVALGPGKFYGSSLPRPRFYTNVKFNDHRVDPPPSVTDPLMSWAEEAHLSMGGLSFKRHRLQGRIEGNVVRLRAQREQIFKKSHKQRKPVEAVDKYAKIPSPATPPVAIKRRRVVGLVDEEAEEDASPAKSSVARKLGNVFVRVAEKRWMDCSSGGESVGAVAARTRSKTGEGDVKERKRLVKGGRKIGAAVVAPAIGNRSSPSGGST